MSDMLMSTHDEAPKGFFFGLVLMKSHANVTVHSFTAKKLMSLMSLTNQKSMNFTTQKSMSLTTQKSMNRRAHKTCLNCLGAIYINLLEVFCFSGGFCAFFHKKLICMFF